MKKINVCIVAIVLIVIAGCNQRNHSDRNLATTKQFIHNPLKGVDVPFDVFEFNAETGDTIYYKSGSFLLFPSNSLVDAKGKPVKGKIKITYREFLNPIDFFISGIPMDYDSGSTKYTFESSAMCEIHAF